jgi:hypothetical protein
MSTTDITIQAATLRGQNASRLIPNGWTAWTIGATSLKPGLTRTPLGPIWAGSVWKLFEGSLMIVVAADPPMPTLIAPLVTVDRRLHHPS